MTIKYDLKQKSQRHYQQSSPRRLEIPVWFNFSICCHMCLSIHTCRMHIYVYILRERGILLVRTYPKVHLLSDMYKYT